MTTLISVQELIDYTVLPVVKERDEQLLQKDILEAELEVKEYCGHDFSDSEKYATIPEEVKLACFKLAQYYALMNSDESVIRGIRSETLGDYSYTKELLQKPNIHFLLVHHLTDVKKKSGKVRFRASVL